MPSSITLTVSHLPTSTSFFLSALQPLNYAYRGRSGQTIGLGPSNSAAPPDFWITQEIPGVPVGAAHVAFPAASQIAVRDFFSAALKAGGKVHGEPAQRDSNGYYSAAIIDFDGNSIEAVFRPGFGEEDKENDVRSVVSRRTSSKASTAISRTPTSASRSPTTASEARSSGPAPTRRTSSPPKGDVLDNILGEARNTANVARNLVSQVRPQLHSTTSAPPRLNNEKSGDAIVGTLLGVAAGAALHYAFASHQRKDTSPPRSQRRPSVSDYGRSYTAPQHYETPSATHMSRDRYITMQDNDRDSTYSSTVRPSSRTHSRSRTSRRDSFDSGIGISPPSPSSRKSMKMLDAPPSAYKAPTQSQAGRSNVSGRSGRSSSTSPTVTQPTSGSRYRSSSASRDAKTVLHIKESLQRTATFPQPSDRKSSTSRSKHSHPTPPERMPLPPSRAATWTDGAASNTSYKSVRSNTSTIMGLDKMSSEASQRKRDLTSSVVGKIREQKGMRLTKREVGPEDSVSQVSSVRSSRRGR